MELDELKVRWQEQDRKLDECLRLNQSLLRDSLLGKADTALKRLSRALWLELGLNVAAIGLLGTFLADHWREPRYLVPAILLDAGVVALIVSAARQLAVITRMDYAAPIVAIQRQVERLRSERIRTMQLTLMLSPLAWTPLFVVAMRGLFDVDVYASFGVAWLIANVVFGVAVIVAALWISYSFADRLDRSPSIQRLLRDIGGQNLAKATEFLNSLAQFAEGSHESRNR
jgi:hypothetical protein